VRQARRDMSGLKRVIDTFVYIGIMPLTRVATYLELNTFLGANTRNRWQRRYWRRRLLVLQSQQERLLDGRTAIGNQKQQNRQTYLSSRLREAQEARSRGLCAQSRQRLDD